MFEKIFMKKSCSWNWSEQGKMGAGNGGRRKKGREREAKSSKYCPGLSGQTPAVGSQLRENLKKISVGKIQVIDYNLKSERDSWGESRLEFTSRGIGNHFTFFIKRRIWLYLPFIEIILVAMKQKEHSFVKKEQDVRREDFPLLSF